MAISFTKDFKNNYPLTVPLKEAQNNVRDLLIQGEECVCAFRHLRERIILTNKRIFLYEPEFSGGMVSISILPYSTVRYFSIRTLDSEGASPGAELSLTFRHGASAVFVFSEPIDLREIGRMISECIL